MTTDNTNEINNVISMTKSDAWICPVCRMGLRGDVEKCNHVAPIPHISPYEIIPFNIPVPTSPFWEIDLTPNFWYTTTTITPNNSP